MKQIHPMLAPLLEKFDISWSLFSKRGRPPKGVREKRSAIVTELHRAGLTWVEMCEVTGLSNGAIQRLTQAKGCEASRAHLRQSGVRVGSSWKGKKRPGQLERQWAAGNFDHLRGAKLPPERVEALKALWTPQRRQQHSKLIKDKVWGDPEVRASLLEFHRSPSERLRRSEAQIDRMLQKPSKWLRGKASYVDAQKESRARIWVRSSYEAAAVRLLDSDPKIISYQYEPVYRVGGRRILPDFLVSTEDAKVLVEVKALWVLSLDLDHPVQKRLELSRLLAEERGWSFEIWTEENLNEYF